MAVDGWSRMTSTIHTKRLEILFTPAAKLFGLNCSDEILRSSFNRALTKCLC